MKTGRVVVIALVVASCKTSVSPRQACLTDADCPDRLFCEDRFCVAICDQKAPECPSGESCVAVQHGTLCGRDIRGLSYRCLSDTELQQAATTLDAPIFQSEKGRWKTVGTGLGLKESLRLARECSGRAGEKCERCKPNECCFEIGGLKTEYRCLQPCRRSTHCGEGSVCDCYPKEVGDSSIRGCVAKSNAMLPAAEIRGPELAAPDGGRP